jgi:hypothetical protein
MLIAPQRPLITQYAGEVRYLQAKITHLANELKDESDTFNFENGLTGTKSKSICITMRAF